MNPSTPTPRARRPRLSAVPASAHPAGGALPDSSITAAEFSESVRIVLSVARDLDLDTPVFRSPPKVASVDRTIQRRGRSTVIAIRRGARPLAAIQADIIEGVVVANYLDPEIANEFRRASWSALDSGTAVEPKSRPVAESGGQAQEGGSGVPPTPLDQLAQHAA